MRRTEATWADLEPGAFVVSDDALFKVVAMDDFDDTITFVDRAGVQSTARRRPPQTPVVMSVPTFEEAVATVQRVLGGQVLTDAQ